MNGNFVFDELGLVSYNPSGTTLLENSTAIARFIAEKTTSLPR